MRVSSSSKNVLIKLLLPTLSSVTRVEQVTFYRRQGKIFLYPIFYTEISKFCHQI